MLARALSSCTLCRWRWCGTKPARVLQLLRIAYGTAGANRCARPPARTLSISAGWGCQKNSSHPDLDLANGGTQRVQSVCAFFSFFCLAVGLVISALSNALKLDDCLRDGQPQRPSARAAPGAQLDANKKQL